MFDAVFACGLWAKFPPVEILAGLDLYQSLAFVVAFGFRTGQKFFNTRGLFKVRGQRVGDEHFVLTWSVYVGFILFFWVGCLHVPLNAGYVSVHESAGTGTSLGQLMLEKF